MAMANEPIDAVSDSDDWKPSTDYRAWHTVSVIARPTGVVGVIGIVPTILIPIIGIRQCRYGKRCNESRCRYQFYQCTCRSLGLVPDSPETIAGVDLAVLGGTCVTCDMVSTRQ